ncbi:hypothetical protein LNAOJCKE_5374 [Methylorubrum aminovorans]|uniref:Uncharacterized protein n=1 Tax=Methylorubrum aminovorans TaxID=269069 RepID=A0ABQ4UNB9_9HYPH|nr:hypothetical protein LNAOJCKE_5374 [Methylorubrum aminovorans]
MATTCDMARIQELDGRSRTWQIYNDDELIGRVRRW